MFVTNIFHFKLYKKYNNSKIFLYNNICNKLILRTSDWQLTNTSNIPKTSSHEKENRNCFPSPTRLSPSIRSLEDLLEYARHEKSAWRVDDSIKWNEEFQPSFSERCRFQSIKCHTNNILPEQSRSVCHGGSPPCTHTHTPSHAPIHLHNSWISSETPGQILAAGSRSFGRAELVSGIWLSGNVVGKPSFEIAN